MAWTAPRTYTTGEVITAAIGNTHWRDNLRYLKGLDGAVTTEDDIIIGGNLLKTTNLSLKEGDTNTWWVRNSADNADKHVRASGLYAINFINRSNGGTIQGVNSDNGTLLFQARDNTVGLVEVMRLQGAADAYVQMTLPQVLTPGTAPGTLVEGHFWYLGADDKLYYRDASANIELVGINAPTRGDTLYRGATNWLNLAKGTAGYYLKQGANDPEWSPAIGLGVLAYVTTNQVSSGVTTFLPPWRGAISGTETTDMEIIMPVAGTIKNMYVRLDVAPGASENVALTTRIDGVDKSLVVTITNTATSGNDTVNSENVSAGERVTIRAIASGSAASMRINVSIQLE